MIETVHVTDEAAPQENEAESQGTQGTAAHRVAGSAKDDISPGLRRDASDGRFPSDGEDER